MYCIREGLKKTKKNMDLSIFGWVGQMGTIFIKKKET